jgi:hypothetical protein
MGFGERFFFYARRVQVLRLRHDSIPPLGVRLCVLPSVAFAWARSQQGCSLFPRLRHMECHVDYSKNITGSRAAIKFVIPSLTTLFMGISPHIIKALEDQTYSDLRVSCIHLRVLRLWLVESQAMGENSKVERFTSSLITASTLLETLIVRIPISNSALLHLESCYNLHQLAISMRQTHITSTSKSRAFRHLRMLGIKDNTRNLDLAFFMLASEPNGKLTSLQCAVECD